MGLQRRKCRRSDQGRRAPCIFYHGDGYLREARGYLAHGVSSRFPKARVAQVWLMKPTRKAPVFGVDRRRVVDRTMRALWAPPLVSYFVLAAKCRLVVSLTILPKRNSTARAASVASCWANRDRKRPKGVSNPRQ